jgi:hypothetical protein
MRYWERQRTGVELGVDEREALECGGFDAAFPFLDRSGEWESGVKAAALQRLPPILMSKLNAIALTLPLPYRSFMPQRLDRVES